MENIFTPADILLPLNAEMEKWAVIACDQFSSEPQYWDRVEDRVGAVPSALRLMLPEAYLEKTDAETELARIAGTMEKYMEAGVFYTLPDSFIYIERRLRSSKTRRGLIGKLDLEAYDFSEGSGAKVQASEHTDVLRLPPRIRMRERSILEMPHIMLLIDDQGDTVLNPISAKKEAMGVLYDFDLMEGGGHITGYRADGDIAEAAISAIRLLEAGGVQMIVGDGNHSLAAAKRVWESVKPGLSPGERENHPLRFALAELTNVYDPSLEIEPIHRAVFTAEPQSLYAQAEDFKAHSRFDTAGGRIGAFQDFLEGYVSRQGGRIDYIHGGEALRSLGERRDTACFLMDAVEKSDLFKTVRAGGVFPKKSFSMGNAEDKRYYLECRKI